MNVTIYDNMQLKFSFVGVIFHNIRSFKLIETMIWLLLSQMVTVLLTSMDLGGTGVATSAS